LDKLTTGNLDLSLFSFLLNEIEQTDCGSSDPSTGTDRLDCLAHLLDDFPLHFHLLQVIYSISPSLSIIINTPLSLFSFFVIRRHVLGMHKKTSDRTIQTTTYCYTQTTTT
jgi:hypothetical protein